MKTRLFLNSAMPDHYEHIAEVPKPYGPKSSIFVPDERLYVAVSGKGKPDANWRCKIYEMRAPLNNSAVGPRPTSEGHGW